MARRRNTTLFGSRAEPCASIQAAATLWACCAVLASVPVYAHDPPEGLSLVWPDEGTDAPPLIVTNRGLVFGDPAPAMQDTRYTLRCNESYMAASTDRPAVFVGAAGALVIGVPYQVLTTSDRACEVSMGTGFGTDPTTTVVRHPSAPQRLFMATRTYKTPSTLFVSEDYGRTFTKHYETELGTFFDGLLVAPSDAQRMYAPAVSFDTVKLLVNNFCARSDDGGKSWLFSPLPGKIIPFAVHPKLADVVFAYEPMDKLETTYRVLRSADGGAHFSSVLENVIKPSAIAASARYTFLGIGGNGGLYRSSDDGQHFEQIQRGMVQTVTCALERKGRLWLCLNMAPNENGIWYTDDEAETFHKLMSFEQVVQPVVCESNQAICAGPWYDFDRELRPPDLDAGGATPDAGPVAEADAGTAAFEDAAAEADAPPASEDAASETPEPMAPPKTSNGCQLGGEMAALEPWTLALLLGLAWRRRRLRS